MADGELISGEGWISDESDFYGDKITRQRLERRARRPLKRPYQQAWPQSVVPVKKVKMELNLPVKADSQTATKAEQNVVDFLRSRPQLPKLQHDNKKAPELREPARTVSGEEAEDMLEDEAISRDPAAWQRDKETILEFLRRLPVSEPSSAAVGPWLWVRSSKQKWEWKQSDVKMNLDAFMEAATLLLQDLENQRAKIEDQNPGKAPATITRKVTPYREQVEDDLLTLAKKTGVTAGKWMFFPQPEDLPRVWRLVAEATAEGKLGPCTKVGTYEPENVKKGTLICVYTYDFNDQADVKRVLLELEELGLIARDARPAYYKCDAYTYMALNGGNVYNIKPSLYSSKEIFQDEVKALKDGPVARLRKKNKTDDSFFAS